MNFEDESWGCEGCNNNVSPDNAHMKHEPTGEGMTTLVFCDGCWDDK